MPRALVLPLLALLLALPQTWAASDKCATCRSMADRFQQRMHDTRKHNFGGGNSDWEERALGDYVKSETRLHEILEGVCPSKDHACHAQVEEGEEAIEAWFTSRDREEGLAAEELVQLLCIDELKLCCPKGHYGKACTPCPGGAATPCSGHGQCDGEGTREGKGKCKCDTGYKGKACSACKKGFFAAGVDSMGVPTCLACDPACTVCTAGSPDACTECASGYELSGTVCSDIDECAGAEAPNCTSDQYCANLPGSAACRSCHAACERGRGCSGGDAADCAACRAGYRRAVEHGPCADIDECAEGKTCETGKFCLNGPGWASCQACDVACASDAGCDGAGAAGCHACKEGYTRRTSEADGSSNANEGEREPCVDVDECAADAGGAEVCPAGRICTNTPGGFTCDCPAGQVLEGETCVKATDGEASDASDAAPHDEL